MKLKLYTNSHSVTCSKIEVAIDFKSIDIEKIEAINNYGAFSPTATVPCLSIDNKMISTLMKRIFKPFCYKCKELNVSKKNWFKER